MAVDFANSQHTSVGGRNKNFVGAIEIFRQQGAFGDRRADTCANFQQDATCDPRKATRIQRRCVHAFAAHTENICCGALGHFTALIEHHCFVKSSLMGFVKVPDIVQPGSDFDASQGRCGMTSIFAQAESYRLAVGREIGGVQDQIGRRKIFVTAPKPLVVNSVDSRATFADLIGA